MIDNIIRLMNNKVIKTLARAAKRWRLIQRNPRTSCETLSWKRLVCFVGPSWGKSQTGCASFRLSERAFWVINQMSSDEIKSNQMDLEWYWFARHLAGYQASNCRLTFKVRWRATSAQTGPNKERSTPIKCRGASVVSWGQELQVKGHLFQCVRWLQLQVLRLLWSWFHRKTLIEKKKTRSPDERISCLIQAAKTTLNS